MTTFFFLITLVPHVEYLPGAKFKFLRCCGFRETEIQSVSFFPIWLPHNVTYYVISIKTFYINSRSNGEKFVAIQQAVAEKNIHALRRDRQTDRQTNGPKCNTLSFGEGNYYVSPQSTYWSAKYSYLLLYGLLSANR